MTVPPEILHKDKGGRQPVAVADNWDLNERAVDGKNTTHAMTGFVVSPKTDDEVAFPHIPRVAERTFDPQFVPGNILISLHNNYSFYIKKENYNNVTM